MIRNANPQITLSLVAAAILLAGLAVETWSRPRASDSADYHARVAELAAEIPSEVGRWTGRDIEPSAAAVQLLDPNVLLQRLYTHEETGELVHMLFVQTRDARDMVGHYPPVCYPAHGWKDGAARPFSVEVDGRRLSGMCYTYSRQGSGGMTRMDVVTFILLPSGHVVGRMQAVQDLAADYTRKHYGAAQWQFLFHPQTPVDRRREIITRLVRPNLILLDGLLKPESIAP